MTEQERPVIPIKKPAGEEAAGAFFQGEERILRDIARGTSFNFKKGDGWAINPETGEGTYDTKFFTEKGYNESQALIASFHEIDHVTELAELLETEEGRGTWESLKKKKQKQERIHLLHNCVTFDPADNTVKRRAFLLTIFITFSARAEFVMVLFSLDKPRQEIYTSY